MTSPTTSSLTSSTDNVTDPLKAVIKTFPAQLLVIAVAIGPFWVLGLMIVANHYLPASDAASFKNLLITMLGSLVVSGAGGGVASSLFRTWGKVATQHANATAQNA